MSSLSQYARIVGATYVVMASIAVIAIDLRVVLIPTACAVLGLIAAGFIVFRPLRSRTAIAWPAQPDYEGELGVVVISGEPCPFQSYEQDLLIEIRLRRTGELLACFLLAAAALLVMLSDQNASGAHISIGPFEAELICMTGGVALLTSLRWLSERRFLRAARITLGSIIGIDPGFVRRRVVYQFLDQMLERRGGEGPFPNDSTDNAVIVLYRPGDPDTNATQGSFIFHSFRIGVLPGRRRATSQEGARN
jgi:hypothetical protein